MADKMPRVSFASKLVETRVYEPSETSSDGERLASPQRVHFTSQELDQFNSTSGSGWIRAMKGNGIANAVSDSASSKPVNETNSVKNVDNKVTKPSSFKPLAW